VGSNPTAPTKKVDHLQEKPATEKALVPSLTPFGSSRAAVGYDRSSSMAFLV
jgi:hypothetical protein